MQLLPIINAARTRRHTCQRKQESRLDASPGFHTAASCLGCVRLRALKLRFAILHLRVLVRISRTIAGLVQDVVKTSIFPDSLAFCAELNPRSPSSKLNELPRKELVDSNTRQGAKIGARIAQNSPYSSGWAAPLLPTGSTSLTELPNM